MERESDYARIKLLVGYIAFPDDGWLADAKAQTTDVRALCNPLHVSMQPLRFAHVLLPFTRCARCVVACVWSAPIQVQEDADEGQGRD